MRSFFRSRATSTKMGLITGLLVSLLAATAALAAPGDITLASTSDDGTKGNASSFVPSLSADGSRVAFHSDATNLDPGDTDSTTDVYVKDPATNDIALASTSDDGTKGNGTSSVWSLSADGTKVAFHSDATNLDPGDTDSTTDVYVKDLVTGDITLASTSDGGTKGNGSSFNPSLSDDGTIVGFQSSATNLDPGDTDSVSDVYVKELGGPAAGADLAVSVADGPDPVVTGQNVTYTVVVTNNGESDATGVSLVDTTNKAGKVQSVTTSQGTCTLNARTGRVDCALGSLADDASATVEIVVKAGKPRAGPITNTAMVGGNEPDPVASNNSDSESTTIV